MISLDRLGGDKPIEDPRTFARGLEGLARMAAELSGLDDEGQVYQTTARCLLDLVPVDRASVGLLSADGSRFNIHGLSGELGVCPPGETIDAAGWGVHAVARDRRYIYAADLSETDLADLVVLREQGLNSAAVIPLVSGDTTIGTLNLSRVQANGFSADELRLLGHAAQFLATAIMSVRRLEATVKAERASATAHELAAQRVRDIECLNRVFRLLNDPAPLNRRLDRVARELTSLRGVDRCELALLDDSGELRIAGRSGWSPRPVDDLEGPQGEVVAAESIHYAALVEARPVWSGETEQDGSWTADELAIPIVMGGSTVGTLGLFSIGPLTFGASQGILAETVAGQVANALDRHNMINQLRRAARTAEESSRARALFLANMSHELRTPMNGVIGMTSLLEGTELTPQQRMYVETIRTSGEAQVAVINHVLDFSKIEADRLVLHHEPFGLRQCVEEALDMAAATLGAKPVDLVYDLDPRLPGQVVGDVTRVRQVLVNLLSNAAKFTDRGEIELRVWAEEPADEGAPGALLAPGAGSPPEAGSSGWATGQVHFSVRDTGVGIPAEQLDQLFEPFIQVLGVNGGSARGGSGLGLTISRQLVQLMGGTISVASTEGVGSTFQFGVNLPGAPMAGGDDFRPDPGLAGRSALVVVPNLTCRTNLIGHLERWGVQVTAAASLFDAAVTVLAPDAAAGSGPGAGRRAVDLMIVDCRLLADGEETWAQLLDTLRAAPVSLCSVGELETTRSERVAWAARVSRPVKPAQLGAALRQAVGLAPPPGREGAGVHGGDEPDALGREHPLRVLVAEDNQVNQKVAVALLERLGYEATVVGDGLTAVEEATEGEGYDLILMDLKMPELSGIEATRAILAQCHERPPRIVAMTADTIQLVRTSCLAAGMADFVTKPVRVEALRDVLLATSARPPLPGPAEPADRPVGLHQAGPPGSTPARADEAPDDGQPRRRAADREIGPVFDEAPLSQLAEVVGGDPRVVAEIVGAYLADTPTLVRDVELGARVGDTELVVAAAHPIVSSSATVGGTALSVLASALVREGRAGRVPSADEVNRFARTAEATADALRLWLTRSNPFFPSAVPPAPPGTDQTA